MRLPLAAALVAILIATSADAQFLVIQTGRSVDEVLATQLQGGKLVVALPSGETVSIPIQFVDTRLTRELAQALDARRTEEARAGARSAPTALSSDSDTTIRQHCESEWKTDFRMRAFCERQQREAFASLTHRGMATGDRAVIRGQCAKEWPGDFRMWNFCEEQQLKALQELKR